MGSFLSLLPVL